MISKLSKKILKFLIDNGVVADTADDREYYRYGIEITVSSILNIVLIMLLGVIYHSVIESLMFLFTFITLRKFTGGFHADTYFKCNASFCLVYTLVIAAYRYIKFDYSSLICVVLLAFDLAVIAVFCPVENVNKPIPQERRPKLKILSAVLFIIYAVIGMILTTMKIKYGILIIYTLTSVSLLIILANIKERICKSTDTAEII